MANVVAIAQFVAGVRARALAPREFQVCLGGIEPYARCAEIRDRGRNHTRPAADIEHSLTRADTGEFQEGPRQTTGPPAHENLISRRVACHKRGHFSLPVLAFFAAL
jgi:hypothetical protein